MSQTAIGMGGDRQNDDLEEGDDDCGVCGGSGEVANIEYDPDSHRHYQMGTKPCICRESED